MRCRRYGELFFTDDRLAQLKPLERIFWLGLLSVADREGRLLDRPPRLRALILPFDKANPDSMLAELAKLGLIRRYEVDGRRLIAIPGFGEDGTVAYQRPHPRETASALPPPPDADNLDSAPGLTKVLPCGDTVTVTETVVREEHPGGSPTGSPGDIQIPLRDGTCFSPTPDQLAEWAAAFPGVDVRRQMLVAGAWARARPERRKTRRGAPAFCVNWLKNAEPTQPPASPAPVPTVTELRAAASTGSGGR